MTTTTPLESGRMAASKTDKRSSLLDWPQLVGLRELDLGTDKLPPLHWLAHPFPAELEVIPDNTPPDVITIIHQSLSFDLYRKRALPPQDGWSDAHQNGDRWPLMSDSQCRQRNGSISQLSRLSSLNNSEGSRSPSKRSVDSGSIRRPLGWIGSKKSNPTRALRDRLRERNTFKECSSCFDEIMDKNLISLNCQHKYCLKCFIQLINTAMATEKLFPPKCCLEEIPQRLILDNLDHNGRDAFRLKVQEYAISEPRRVYCPEITCAKWIPPNKLKKGKKPSQKSCPYCRNEICTLCRSLAHANLKDCPQDYGLEATLEEAEYHGWRRCYSCHSMVELTAGCRHITCNCGSEFCYTCAARWHTCDCTEDDHRRRQAEIEARRLQRDRQIQKEAAEIAEAIAQIERMEREEAMERERRGEEQRRKEEEELRDREMKRMMHIASTLRGLQTALSSVNEHQQTLLNKRHEKAAHGLHSRTTAGTSVVEQQRDKLLEGLRTNQKQRMDQLIVSQKAEFDSMIARHEEEEDDTLLTVSRHLKRKTNRESREKAILDKLKASQESERRTLEQAHRQAILTQEQNNNLELKALEAGLARDCTSTRETELDTTSKLTQMVLIDRSWFTAAVEKRWMMLDEYRFRLIDTGADIGELAAVEVVPDSVELPADSEFGNANAEVVSTSVQTAPVLVSVTSSEPEPLLEPELGPQHRPVVPAAPSMLGKQPTPAAVVPGLPKQKKKRAFSRLVSQSPYSLLG
ncbi:IBR domain-containing protein [Histoplasma ohiense]|nr:IBR domain-containing protein [Histoplasma ohiense (nom. inval.)]